MNRRVIRQLLLFGCIGALAFVIDTAALYAALAAGAGPYVGRLASYLVAATFTWAMNRHYTFRELAGHNRLLEWLRFLAANAVGGSLNYGCYALLIASSPLVRQYPVIGVAAGSLAGMSVNFLLSRQLVFRPR